MTDTTGARFANMTADQLVAAYNKLTDRSDRATFRSTIDSLLSASLNPAAMDVDSAVKYNTVKLSFSVPTVVPVDHGTAVTQRVADMRLAADVMALVASANNWTMGDTTPDPQRAINLANAYGTDVSLSEPDSTVMKLVRIPRVASPNRTYNGPRRSVPAHIESAFEGLESGDFLKIGEIARHSSATYGDDHPTDGAVGAALFTRDGVARVINDSIIGAIGPDGKRGAQLI